MKTGQYKQKGHPVTPMLSAAIGVSVCVLMSLFLSAVAAYLVAGEQLPQSAINSTAIPIQLLAVYSGCITAMILSGKMPAVIASACAGSYFVLLVCTNILVLDSSLGGAGKGFLAVLGGAILAVITMLLGKKNKKHKKVRIR